MKLRQQASCLFHELARIRGSVGCYTDFTSAFLPRRDHLRQRWERVNTMVSTQDMPPIEVYQVGDAYFVVDGNHRVSNARQEGIKWIAADVCEFVTPMGLSAEADLDEVITKSEYAEFLDKTHLDKLRPGQEIIFTTPGHYPELECLITMFQEALEETRGEVTSYEDTLERSINAAFRDETSMSSLRWNDSICSDVCSSVHSSFAV